MPSWRTTTRSAQPAALWILCLVTLLSALPMLALVSASSVADALGCKINEGATDPCFALQGRVRLGELLAYTAIAGVFLSVLTAPVLAVCGVAWVVVAAVLISRRLELR